MVCRPSESHVSMVSAILVAHVIPACTVLMIVSTVDVNTSQTSVAHSPIFLTKDTAIVMTVVPALLIAFQMGVKMLSFTHFPTFFSAFFMPSKIPLTIFSPGSSIVLAGEAIPKAFLKPSMKGVKM